MSLDNELSYVNQEKWVYEIFNHQQEPADVLIYMVECMFFLFKR